jgi:hypothetical protein
VFVSIVSTKIPFKGTSKEYIGEDVEPIADAVDVPTQTEIHAHTHRIDDLETMSQFVLPPSPSPNLNPPFPKIFSCVFAIASRWSLGVRGAMSCCAQLKHHIARREAEKEARNRRKNLTKYVPDVSDALFKVKTQKIDRHFPSQCVCWFQLLSVCVSCVIRLSRCEIRC